MSDVGITVWYNQGLSSNMKPQTLVFDIYPLEFLREAAQRLGAMFYESSASRLSPSKLVTKSNVRDFLFQRKRNGKMLPFSRDSGWFCGVTGSFEHVYLEIDDHPAVRTWKICRDGTVDLPEVGLSFTSNQTQKLEGILYIVQPEDDKTKAQGRIIVIGVADVSEQLRKLRHRRLVVGVALYADCQYQHGCLLQKVRFPYRLGRTRYVKIGSYIIWDQSMPVSRSVNWKVL